MATTGSAKKHSKLDKQEITQGLNQLYTPPSFAKNPAGCIDIIAVPGLGADMTRTWMSKNVHWLKDDTMLQKVVPEARISVFGYRSQWFGPDAVPEARISSIADDLLHHIYMDREGKNSKRPIIFIGHSLGGLVVAKAVSEAKRRPEDYPGVFSCITSCIFLGTPFRGSDAQKFAELIGMAGDIIGLAKYTDLIKSLKAGSIELDDLANDFLGDARKASVDIVCYYETENTAAKPEWDIGKLFKTGVVIASKKSSTFEGYPNFSWARTHTQMNKFDGPKDVQYKDVAGTLKDLAHKSFKIIKMRHDSTRQDLLNDGSVDRILEGLEVINIKKDLATIKSVQGTSRSWILDYPEYIGWKESTAHQTFWVSGGPGMGKTKIAISAVDDLDNLTNLDRNRDDSPTFAYFFCDEQDRDKSKALNVLKLLVYQLLTKKKFLARYFATEESKSKNATTKIGTQSTNPFEFHTLTELWKCLKAALMDPSLGTVYFLVNSLDQIDSESRKEFLNLITSWKPPILDDEDGRAPVVKWLFLSVPRPDIQEALQSSVRANLDDGSNSANQNDALRELVAEEVGKISKKKNYSRSLEYFAKSYISFRAEGKSNLDWVNLVCLELEYDGQQYTAIRQHLESLPSDLGPMYDQLSRRVLNAPASIVETSKEILRSLLLVHSPPTLYELAVIADLPNEIRNNEAAISGLIHHCGAFTQIFEDNGKLKVQLSYNSVRNYLKSKANDWLSMPSEQIQHGLISLRCFDYVRAAVKKAAALNHAAEKEEAKKNDDDDEEADDEEAEDEDEDKDDDDEATEKHAEKEKATEPETDPHVVLKVDDTQFKTAEPDLMPLDYPHTEWIEHALEATPDIVECFDLEEMFWLLESEERAEWSRSYSTLNEQDDFDVKFTALHIAAYFGYVPLADVLLRNPAHTSELGVADSNGHHPLYWASVRGHMNMVQKLVDEGGDVNGFANDEYGDIIGLTPLHGAASGGSVEIAEYLLDKGATVDILNDASGTALYVAAEEEHVPMVQLLLDRGANSNAIGGGEMVPLNVAALCGNLEIVKLLVKNGAQLDPEIEYTWGSALGVAAYYGSTEVVKFLLESGCRFDVDDSDGDRPLSLAAREGYPEIVKIILGYDKDPEPHQKGFMIAVESDEVDCVRVFIESCPVLQRTEPFRYAARSGFTEVLNVLTNSGISREDLNGALYEATDIQQEETVAVLLEMGADPNAEGDEFGNALQAAAIDGSETILAMLLDKGADPNRVYGEETYGTALQAAAFEGSIDNVKLLVERGATLVVQKCGKYGNPLKAACSADKEDVVEYLLSAGVDANIFGGPDNYPLLAATKYGYGAIVKLLLSHGANVNVRDPQQCTPLINAASELPRDIIELLVSHGANIHDADKDGDTAFIMAAQSGDQDTAAYLLDLGSDIQKVGKWGGALYRATEDGGQECIKLLLDRGIDVNQLGGEKHTSLQMAASRGNVQSVKLLLEFNADVNICGGMYHTALIAAVSAEEQEIVELLLEKGARINEQGGKYGTPLHTAIYRDNLPIVDLLLEKGANINAVDEVLGSTITHAAGNASTEVLERLIEKGGDVNLQGGKYHTPLQMSAYMESLDEVGILLKKGADPLVVGGYYGSALAAAASVGSGEISELLLGVEKEDEEEDEGHDEDHEEDEEGRQAEQDLKDQQKREAQEEKKKNKPKPPKEMLTSALFTAVHYRQPNTVKLLLENGADVTAKNVIGYGNVMEAWEAPMTAEEILQSTGDADEEEEDEDGNDDEEEEDEEEEDEEEEDDEDDVNEAEAIEIHEGIKEMLTKALEAAKATASLTQQTSNDPSGYSLHNGNGNEDMRSPDATEIRCNNRIYEMPISTPSHQSQHHYQDPRIAELPSTSTSQNSNYRASLQQQRSCPPPLPTQPMIGMEMGYGSDKPISLQGQSQSQNQSVPSQDSVRFSQPPPPFGQSVQQNQQQNQQRPGGIQQTYSSPGHLNAYPGGPGQPQIQGPPQPKNSRPVIARKPAPSPSDASGRIPQTLQVGGAGSGAGSGGFRTPVELAAARRQSSQTFPSQAIPPSQASSGDSPQIYTTPGGNGQLGSPVPGYMRPRNGTGNGSTAPVSYDGAEYNSGRVGYSPVAIPGGSVLGQGQGQGHNSGPGPGPGSYNSTGQQSSRQSSQQYTQPQQQGLQQPIPQPYTQQQQGFRQSMNSQQQQQQYIQQSQQQANRDSLQQGPTSQQQFSQGQQTQSYIQPQRQSQPPQASPYASSPQMQNQNQQASQQFQQQPQFQPKLTQRQSTSDLSAEGLKKAWKRLLS